MSDSATRAAADADANSAPAVFCRLLAARFGDRIEAIVLYGSYLRGKRDTVLDFYVLLDDYRALDSRGAALANRALPPNVYHLRPPAPAAGSAAAAAKYATLTLARFERAMRADFHPYFWARFAQPVTVLYARDAAVRRRVDRACRLAAARVLATVVPMMPATFTTSELWRRAFTLTYACELRSEHPGRAAELTDACAAHLERLTGELAATCGLVASGGGWQADVGAARRRRTRLAWRLRRLQGKALSLARLFKAAFTFNEPLDYLVWKVERHSGIRAQPTPLQRRHPLLFAWPLLWRLYRRGGFR